MRILCPLAALVLVANLSLFPFHAADAQEVAVDTVTVPPLDGDIVIDGVIDESAWRQATPIDIDVEIQPGDNTPAPVATTVRIGYTHDALYLAFHATDPDPAAIRAHLTDRDSAYEDDLVGVMLDTFDDHRRNYEFFVNPLGVQMDMVREEAVDEDIRQEATGDEDDSWDGLWTSAARITDDGYEVEMRIPFSTLRFRGNEGSKRWGVIALRTYPRGVRHQLANVAVPRGSNCLLCLAARTEGMAGVEQGHDLEITPILAATDVQTRGSADEPWRGEGVRLEPGVDVAWTPSPSLTLNATLNPDFSQVESDQSQLDLSSSFALYFPEKRPFFMEGADYFSTPLQVLYTRQVADPDFGLRVTGRTGSGAYGAFAARDATTQLLVPGVLGSGFTVLDEPSDVAAARYRHDLDAHTSVGAIATSRHGDDYGNDVAGIDGRWQNGSHTLSAQLLHSGSHYPLSLDLDDDRPSGNARLAEYTFDSRGWYFDARNEKVDAGFRADLGFIGQVGYDKSGISGRHTRFRDGAKIHRINLYSDLDITHRNDGQLLERELELELNFDGPMQSSFGIHGLSRARFWDGRFFDESYLRLYGSFTPRPGLELGADVRVGPQLDLETSRRGQGRYGEVWGDLSLGRGFSVGFDLLHQDLQSDGRTVLAATVLDTRLGWQFDPRQRLRVAIRTGTVDKDPAFHVDPVVRHTRDIAAQLIYSYKVNPRTALYAGGTLGGFLDDDNPDLFANRRSVFLKLSYGWQP